MGTMQRFDLKVKRSGEMVLCFIGYFSIEVNRSGFKRFRGDGTGQNKGLFGAFEAEVIKRLAETRNARKTALKQYHRRCCGKG